MFSGRIFGHRFRVTVTILCILGMLVSSAPHPLASVSAQVGGEPKRARSNYDTQIKVLGPSNVRINTWSGNLFYPVPILTIPGRGLPIEIFMGYNSSWHDFATHYGCGWQLSYNMFYVRDENGDIIIVWEDGRNYRFVYDNGSFLSPADTYDTLQEYQPGKYVLRTKYGIEFYFDSPIHKRLTKLQEPNGNALTFAYDSDMRLTSIIDTVGRQVEFFYTDGNLTTITDAGVTPSRSIQFQYDANNNLISITDALGNETRYGYDSNHLLTSITPPRGTPTIIAYSDGVVTEVSGELTTKSFSYDMANRITTMTDVAPEGDQTTRFFYDADGRITTVENPLHNNVSLIWDENNNLTSFTDENGNTTTYAYDAMGNLLTVTDALGNTTAYTYENTYNRLETVTDANEHTTTYEYDSQGNLISETDALGSVTSYAYDSMGELISRTDANGTTTTYEYHADGNLAAVIYPDSSTISYDYDAVGNMTEMTNADVSVLYSYDAVNRVTNANVASHDKSISYAYDEAGNRINMTDADGGVTTYEYDDANRLVRLTNPLEQTTSYTYDSRGRLIRKDYHNGTYALYTYAQANRLISLTNKKSSGEVISSYTYEYDAAGNRTKMIEANGDETTYDYDDLYQLTSMTYPDGSTVEYAYDAVGNRLVLTDTTGTTEYSYDDADRLQSGGPVTYDWDNNGNLISKTDEGGTTTYAYDYENRLISITFPDGDANAFTYYPDGRRLSKTDTSGKTTYYFHDGPNAIAEANSAGATIARYTSGLGTDDWISMDRADSSYYYHHDGLGSVTRLTTHGGAVVATYKYDVFGAIRSQTGNVVNFYRFTGREYDEENKLFYYRSRYYDPAVGRFVSADPFTWGPDDLRILSPFPTDKGISFARFSPQFIISSGQANPRLLHSYLYILNDPVNHIDPSGMSLFGGIIKLISNFIPVPWWAGVLIAIGLDLIFPEETGDGDVITDENGTSGGQEGGFESKPLNVAPSAFLEDGSRNRTLAFSPKPQSEPLITLGDIIPTEGPEGTAAVPTIPADALAMTDRSDAAAMDFVDDETGAIKASVLGIETIEGPYDHDYAVCASYHGYTIESVAPIPLPGLLPGATGENTPWFWYTSARKGEILEEALTFVVFVNETQKEFTLDSRWLADYYPEQFDFEFDYVFNFQIWASSAEETYMLLKRTAENLANFEGGAWTVSFLNTVEPTSPTALIKVAEYADDEVKLTVRSWLTEIRTVTFSGSWRSYDDWNTSIDFNHEVSVTPGTSTISLPFENLLDAVIVSNVDGFLSKVYVGSGFWFVFNDEQSTVTMAPGECTPITNVGQNDLVLAGCVEMTGSVTTTGGYVGLARTLNPNGVPVDVNHYGALTFFAKGDGKGYRVNIETASVEDCDYHQFVFTAPTEWRQFVIPLFLFEQRGWGQPVPFTGTDVRSVAWLSVGAPTDGSVNLAIDKVAFTNSTIISDTTVLSNTNDVVGPYTVTTEISDDVGIEAASLYYSVDGGNSFTPVVMTSNSNAFSGQIPGQPLDTEVRYYVEATDADGNTATDPVDIPYTTYRFQVSENPFLLVDDFRDANPANVLGAGSGMFDNPEAGGAIAAYYNKESLRLDYDVVGTDKYAGYYTRLNQANLTPYNAVTFLMKGANGEEKAKIGLRDNLGNEPKIVLSEYLARGITTSWQKVTIPLVAFTRIVDWSSMESLSVAFENRIGSGASTVYLDDVKFEHIPSVPVVVDNFNDMTGENGLGGSLWTASGGGATINAAYDPANARGDSGAGYRVSYSGVTGTAWAAVGTELMDLDASTAKTLSFYIKGGDGGERPNFYLANRVDGTETRSFVDIENYVTVTTSWQRVDIPLEDFASQGIDLTNLAYFQVAFEWEEMVGTIYLDDIQVGSIFGDINWDCDVDVSDITQLTDRWRSKIGSPHYVSIYDLDYDGDIDIVDITKVAATWGATCR